MPEYTADEAVQALAAAWQQDDAPEAATAPSEGQTTESNQTASEEKPAGLFYDVDPNTLTPELRRMFDGMQAAFTQKNQEIAEQRRQLESFGNPEQVQQAVEFVQSLEDPNNLVRFHTELSDYLQQAGYTKDAADAAATSAIQETQAETQEFGTEFADPELAQLRQELDSLRSWQQNFQAEQEQKNIEMQLERMEVALRNDRGYNDQDISRIYQLSYAYGADLFAAADAFDQMKQDFISGYVNSKGEAVTSVTPPPSTTMGQIPPPGFGSDFEAAHKEAKRIALAAQAAGAFDE